MGTESAGRPSASDDDDVKSSHTDVTVKEASKTGIETAMSGRKGKVRVLRVRLQGLTKKAVSRKSKKCTLTPTQRQSAIDNFAGIAEGDENATLSVLHDRTNDVDSPPFCRRIHKMLFRKIVKIAKKAKNQTRLA